MKDTFSVVRPVVPFTQRPHISGPPPVVCPGVGTLTGYMRTGGTIPASVFFPFTPRVPGWSVTGGNSSVLFVLR